MLYKKINKFPLPFLGPPWSLAWAWAAPRALIAEASSAPRVEDLTKGGVGPGLGFRI